MKIIQSILIFLSPLWLYGQNTGVGTLNPTEKLEVAGKIFTNQGGIKFPDHTVQTTAAFNQTVESAAMPRGIGFIKFPVIELYGPYDTLGLLDVSIIYSCDLELTYPAGGGVSWGDLIVSKLNDRNSQRLLKYIALQTALTTVRIYLTKETPSGLEVYYETKLTNVKLSLLAPEMKPGNEGGFAHIDKIGLRYDTITFFDWEYGCYCFNVVTNMACGCP